MSLFRKIFGLKSDESTVEVKSGDRGKYMPEIKLPIDEKFTINFKANGGKFLYCEDINEDNGNLGLILDENDGAGDYGSLVYPNHNESTIDAIMNDFMGITRYIKMPTLPYDGIHHIDMHMKLTDEELQAISPGQDLYPNPIVHISFQHEYMGTCEMLYSKKHLVRDVSKLKPSDVLVGRFVSNFLTKAGVEFTKTDLDNFIDKYKSEIKEQREKFTRFEIVK